MFTNVYSETFQIKSTYKKSMLFMFHEVSIEI